MQKRKIDELISYFNRKVADMNIEQTYKMELLGMITAIGIASEKESKQAEIDKAYELGRKSMRKTGKWITTRTWEHDGEIYCSHCGGEALTDGDYRQVITDYCPKCGCRMVGDEE